MNLTVLTLAALLSGQAALEAERAVLDEATGAIRSAFRVQVVVAEPTHDAVRRTLLVAHADALGITPAEWRDEDLERAGRRTVLSFRRTIDGVPVRGGVLRVSLEPDGSVWRYRVDGPLVPLRVPADALDEATIRGAARRAFPGGGEIRRATPIFEGARYAWRVILAPTKAAPAGEGVKADRPRLPALTIDGRTGELIGIEDLMRTGG
jgi:hypothetical protein